jgi:hypothetical protein
MEQKVPTHPQPSALQHPEPELFTKESFGFLINKNHLKQFKVNRKMEQKVSTHPQPSALQHPEPERYICYNQ